jgi:lipoate-protein ligase A
LRHCDKRPVRSPAFTLRRNHPSPPTLRLYQWDPPTISLGYFQKYADYQALAPPAGDLPVVRRLTGGGAILHDRELTYSLTLPIDHALLADGPNALYELLHDVVITCLAEQGIPAWRGCRADESSAARGPFFCFARRHRYDVLIGNDKVAGSAQRRTRKAVLQHGSIVLQRRYQQQPAATAGAPDFDAQQLAERLTSTLAAKIACRTVTGDWTAPEREATRQLTAKYSGADWLRRR